MLNACPKCQRTFPAEEGAFCPEDATKLLAVDEVPIAKDPNDPLIGHVIAGRYEIRRVVADGAMGRVYEGRALDEQKRVAIKILHAEVAEDDVNIERFRREAETSRKLDHEFIVEVLDFSEDPSAPGRKSGAWYLVMEYLDGEELRSLLDRTKLLPMARVVRIIAQTAIALDGAHAQGFVHRDLKPDNIFLVRTPQGDRVKLLDFGSVKFTKGQDRGVKLTVMGTTIGSPFYMSPEQAKGDPDLDHRTDVWALGAILYEMTVGQVPFHAPNGPQILFKIISEEAMPPSLAKDDAAPQLDDLMVKALAKKRDQRFRSCGELADALGHSFGLEGSHKDWARASEADIAARLSAAAAPRPAVSTPTTAKPFASLQSATGLNTPERPALPESPRAASSIDVDAGVPDDYTFIKKPSPALYAIAGMGVLLALTLVAYLAMR